MASWTFGKKQRSLFGLGLHRGGAEIVAAPPGESLLRPITAERDELTLLNLKVLAAAVLQGQTAQSTSVAPLLQACGLVSRAPTLADITSPWFAYWAAELQCAVRAERKLWESIRVLQAFYDAGVLTAGSRALGFGVGDEALPSYLASIGLQVVATDLPGVADAGDVWKSNLIDKASFARNIEVSDLDIRRLDDATLRGFDGCWSCSVINELTSFEEAAEAAILTMDTLRPGGLAVHVMEYAFANDKPAENTGELCFDRNFFEKLAGALNGRGHKVAPLDFDLGGHPLDGYIDAEPFAVGAVAGFTPPHLKIRAGGEMRTSFLLAVTARG